VLKQVAAKGPHTENKSIVEIVINVVTRLSRIKMEHWIVMSCKEICLHLKTVNILHGHGRDAGA
jgi:hypothetical protein